MGSARRCLTCKVIFDNIDALNEHCALSTHPLNPHRCQPCDRAFTTPSGLQMHLDSASHKLRSRAQISAQTLSQASTSSHAGAPQPPVPDVAGVNLKTVEDPILAVCSRCKLTFENHQLLFEHYQTSSMHRVCTICLEVFPKTRKNLLKKHMAECHSQDPTPKSTDCKKKIAVPAQSTSQPKLPYDYGLVLLAKSFEPSTLVTRMLQTEKAKLHTPYY